MAQLRAVSKEAAEKLGHRRKEKEGLLELIRTDK